MNDRKVRRCARPIDIRNGNRKVVLCLHGFTGYPGEMAFPAKVLGENGWDVRVPRLTGHGTDGKDFIDTRPKHWARQVADEWLNLSATYEQVYVLGHSMGGLFALNLALEHPVERVAVLAPAIGIRLPGQALIGPMSLFFRKRPFPWKPDPSYSFFDDRDDGDDLYLGAEYWSWIWFRHIAALQSLMKRVERQLGHISSPTLGVFGGKDTVVGPGGLPLLEKRLAGSFESLVLEDCGHYIPYDPGEGMKEQAMDAVVKWFEQ